MRGDGAPPDYRSEGLRSAMAQPTDPPAPDEDALATAVRAARAGDVAAFNQLVGWHQGLAYHVAYRIVGDAELAADATQDAFVAAFRAIPQFRGTTFRVWLLRIVTNHCLDALRARKRRPTVSLDALAQPDPASPHFADPAILADDSSDPAALAERRELAALLRRGLADLPDDQRVAVVLSDIEGASYEEIAAIMAVPVGTVKSRIARGRARLRDWLDARRELLPRAYRHTPRPEPPKRGAPSDPRGTT